MHGGSLKPCVFQARGRAQKVSMSWRACQAYAQERVPKGIYTPSSAGLDFRDVNPTYLGEKMARAIEVAVVEAVEGKTRAQQIARLKEWKKFWLDLGAEKVVVQEVAVGNLNGGWIFSVHHKSGAAYGVGFDDYFKNTKSFDAVVDKWIKTPTLKISSFSLTFELDEI
jgi:hypothetical protein